MPLVESTHVSTADMRIKSLKTIPIVTILLMLNTIFLQPSRFGTYEWWKARLEQVPGGQAFDHFQHCVHLLVLEVVSKVPEGKKEAG